MYASNHSTLPCKPPLAESVSLFEGGRAARGTFSSVQAGGPGVPSSHWFRTLRFHHYVMPVG